MRGGVIREGKGKRRKGTDMEGESRKVKKREKKRKGKVVKQGIGQGGGSSIEERGWRWEKGEGF